MVVEAVICSLGTPPMTFGFAGSPPMFLILPPLPVLPYSSIRRSPHPSVLDHSDVPENLHD